MKALTFAPATIATVTLCSAALAQPEPTDFEGAQWVWYSYEPLTGLSSIPAGANYFRTTVTLPDEVEVTSADVIVTCDNLFVLYVNGAVVGESDANNSAWGRPKRFDVSSLLVPGSNAVAVLGVNTLPGPAGLIAKLVAQLADGQQVVLTTNANWKCSETMEVGWTWFALIGAAVTFPVSYLASFAIPGNPPTDQDEIP